MTLQGHCLNVGSADWSSTAMPFEGPEFWLSGLALRMQNEGRMEAETQVDILGEIADLDPDFDDLVERCCEWADRDAVHSNYD